MKVDILELLLFFDNFLSSEEMESDGILSFSSSFFFEAKINFLISIYEEKVSIIVSNSEGAAIFKIVMSNCSEIRILDQKKKHLEVIDSTEMKRCTLTLLGESLFRYSEQKLVQ